MGYPITYEDFTEAFISVPWNHRLVQYIETLDRRVLLGLITDNAADRIKDIQEKFDVMSLFEISIVSGQTGFRKTTGQCFRLALEACKLEGNRCLFIDNNQENIESARRHGMKGYFHSDRSNDLDSLKLAVENFLTN